MTEPGSRFWQIFFEVYEHLPRQGRMRSSWHENQGRSRHLNRSW